MKRILLRTLLFTGVLGVVMIAQTNASGPGSGYTNAPSESACNTSGCHTGSLITSGTKYDKITLLNNFTGNGYIPDSIYTLYLTYRESGKTKYGYQITSLAASNNDPAGTFNTPDSRSQKYTYTVSSKNRNSLGHTSTGTAAISSDSQAWKITWKAPATNVGNIIFYITLNVTDNNGQNTNDVIYAKQITVGPSSLLPKAKLSLADTFLCTNLPVNFTGANSTGSPTSYIWQFPPNYIPVSTTSSSNTFNFTTSGTYKVYLTVKNSKGTSATDTLSFAIKTGASAPDINPPAAACAGDTVTLSPKFALSGHSFLWTPGNITTRTIKVSDTSSYRLKAILNSNGCYRISAPVKVTFNQVPQLSMIKSFTGDTICKNTTFSLGTLVTSGTADSFSFVSKSGPYSKKDTIERSLASGPASFSVWGKTTKGCISKPSSLTLQVKNPEPGPQLSVSNITFTGFKVSWASVSGALGYKISTDSGKTFVTPSSGSTGLSHQVSGLLGNHTMKVLVYALTPGLCGTSEITDITATTLSCGSITFDIQALGNTRTCLNNSVPVVLHKLAGKKIRVLVDGVFVGTDTSFSITNKGSRPYDISILDSAALFCGYTTKSISLVEDTIVTPVSNLGSVVSSCSSTGSSALQMNIGSHSTIDSVYFIQNNNIVALGKAIQHTYTVSHGDSVWAVAKNSNGCMSAPGNKTHVMVYAYPSAQFNTTNTHFDYTFSAADTLGSHSYKIGADSLLGHTVNIDLTPYKNDTAVVTHIIIKNGCKSVQTLKVYIPDFTGVVLKTIPGAKIYPNPASQLLNVYIPKLDNNASIEIYSPSGAKVLSAVLHQGLNEIVTESLPSGVYGFRVHSGKRETTGSIMIER